MKKRVLLIALLFVLFGFMISTLSVKLKAATINTGDVDILICNPGEDASTEMRFSFHTKVAGVTVQIAKKSDGNFDNAIKISPECMSTAEAWPFQGTSWGMAYGDEYDYKNMKICEATATGLEPSTEYMYRVGATNFSETRYFKTAGSDGTWTFIVQADPQTYAADGLVAGIQDNMNRAIANARKLGGEPELIVSAGDDVNDGGVISYWRGLYGITEIYKQMPFASVVGNHDCLDGAGGKVTSGMYVTAAMWNAPKNGPNETYKEDCYWFKWNNVLFCMMNSEAGGTSKLTPQTEWFKEVTSTVDYQYLVVMYHQGQWGTTSPSPNIWFDTFEEYNIDLSFSGDNHDYGRGGVNVGPARGQDKYPGHYVVVDDTRNADNAEKGMGGYCIVKVTPSCLYYYAYDQYDNIRDQAVFTAQRPLTKDASFDKAKFEESLKIEVVETDSKKAALSYGEGFIGNVGYITILNEAGAEVKKFFPNSTKVNSTMFGGLTPDTEYNYKIKVEYKDGTSSTVNAKFKTTINYGTYSNLELKELSSSYRLTFNPDDIKNKLLTKVNVYIDGEKKAEYAPDAKFVSLDKALITDDSKIELKGVVKSDNSEVLIGTYSKNAPEVKVPELTVETKAIILKEGESAEIKATVTENAKLVYSSSDTTIATVNDSGKVTAIKAGNAKITVKVDGFDVASEVAVTVEKKEVAPTVPTLTVETKSLTLKEGESAEIKATVTESAKLVFVSNDTSIATVDASGKVTALKEGTVKITIKVDGFDVSAEVTVKVEKKETETPGTPDTPDTPDQPDTPDTPDTPAEPKKGCGSGAIQMVWSFITILGLVAIFRRRKMF